MMITKLDKPCASCGCKQGCVMLDTSDQNATEWPTFVACLQCRREIPGSRSTGESR